MTHPRRFSRAPNAARARAAVNAPHASPAGSGLLARAPGSADGFSLTELMVVIIVLSIVTATVTPQFVGSLEDATLRRSARELAATLRLARSHAVTTNAATRFLLDAEGHYWIEGRGRSGALVGARPFERLDHVPGTHGEITETIATRIERLGAADQRLASRGGSSAESADGRVPRAMIRFLPDGTTEAIAIVLRDRDGFELRVRLVPATAAVEIDRLGHDGIHRRGEG